MKQNNEQMGPDYFRLYLIGHLRDHWLPQYTDKRFIEERTDIGKRYRQCLVPWDATTSDEWRGGRKSATLKTALPFIALIWTYRQRRGISFAGHSSPFA